MRRFLSAANQRLLGRRRRSARVADESALEGIQHGGDEDRGQGGWCGLSAVLSIVRMSLELVSCLMLQTEDGSEFIAVSDMNELMVRDGMRYAIYV